MKEAKVYYYVTLCTKDGTPSLWQPGTAADLAPGAEVPLSEGGLAVEKVLGGITEKFEQAAPEKYVVMPNHVHIVLALERGEGQPDASLAKVVSSVAAYLKRASTKEVKTLAWQRSSNDRPIRGEEGLRVVSAYVDENPSKWSSDCYCVK